MAIIVEEEKKEGVSFTLIVAGLVLIAAVIVTYFLFFIPVPGIEKVIVPPRLQSLEEISKISFDVEMINNSSIYKLLDSKYAKNPPVLGVYGRANPFAPF